MTNALVSIALLAPPVPDHCKELATFAFNWGRAFIVASFVFAVVGTLLTLIITLIKAWHPDKPKLGADPDAWAKFLDSLKGVLEALAALPAWIAIYLAGLTLLWIAGHPSGICPA
jgi:hypothetical protein